MKYCPQCGAQLDDAAVVCTNCGFSLEQPRPQVAPQPVPTPQPAPQPEKKATDFTADYDEKDIADNKIYAILPYALGLIGCGVVGIFISLLGAKESAFVKFHVKENVKLLVCDAIIAVITALLGWLILPAIAACIALCVIYVLRIIAFFNVCKGKAVLIPLISSISFLN